jgi:hypothetical protein
MRSASAMCLLGVLVACASIPDVEYTYYMSKMNGVATVTQTLRCTQDNKDLVIVNTPSFVPTYTADLSRGTYKISIRDIEGTFRGFADSDANFGFFDDGRLKTINQSTTGQGEAAIKSIVSLATTVTGLGGVQLVKAEAGLPECTIIENFGGKDKQVSLSYRAEVNFPNNPPPTPNIEAKPTEASKQLFDQLNKGGKLPNFQLWIGKAFDAGSRATSRSPGGDTPSVNLTLQRVATVEVRITAEQKSEQETIWKGNVALPGAETYELPIPRAALFGSQKFSLTLSEAGAITAVDYGKGTGAAGAANAIATALGPETTATKATDLKTQADLIAQQTRLHNCQVKPLDCK